MIKIFTVIFLMSLTLFARENPFFPSSDADEMLFTTNKEVVQVPLQRAAISLPSTARILESVTVKYKNLDGSIVEKTEELGNSVDWHIPLFISQNINTSIVGKAQKKKVYLNVFSMKHMKIQTYKNEIKILTQDKMVRNFLLTNPHRIVCDFKRDIGIRSLEKNIKKKSVVKKIRVGNHKGYYRVVLELDGFYKYELLKSKDTQTFVLH